MPAFEDPVRPRASAVAPDSQARASSSSPTAADALAAALPSSTLAWAHAAPMALAVLDDGGRVAWINAAFEALTGFAPCDALGQAITALLQADAPDWMPGAGRPVRRTLARRGGDRLACDVQCDPLAPGLRMLTLIDRTAEAAGETEVRRLLARLEFVQTTARIGMWERDARTLEGRWDDHMFRFFGVDPARGTPSIAQIGAAIMTRDRLSEALTDSMKKPGRYTHRYRLLTPEGSLRRIRSHWEVFAAEDGSADQVLGLVMDDTEAFELASSMDDHSAQFQLATELASVSMWRHDLVARRMYFNERAFEVIGQPPRPEGMSIEEFRELIHPDDMPEVIETYQRALRSTQPEDMQVRYRHTDGRWRHVFTRRVTQRDVDGQPIALSGVALDITAQVERTQRADELARHLDAVTAASGIGIWRIRRDGSEAEWNVQMLALSGMKPGEVPPNFHQWIDRCVHPDDRERVRRIGREWLNDPSAPAELAHRIVMPDGEVRHVVARGHVEPAPSPYRLTGVSIDVTERERAIAALREAMERSAIATRAAGIGLWEWDADTLASRWDEEMYRLRGRPSRPGGVSPSLDEMVSWLHPDDRHFVNDQIHSARVEDRPAYYEFRVQLPDGGMRWLASRSVPLRDERGRTHMRLGVNWDVTEARAAAAARQERALVLRESQAKSELLARMSHELRTPMNAVLGFTQLLIEDDAAADRRGVDDDPARLVRLDRLEHIRAAGEHLLTLIDDVLDVSRLDGPEPAVTLQPVLLATVIAQTLPLVERLAREHDVSVIAEPSPLHVRADATRLKQVLVNLLTNAIKYNRPGGSVRLEAVPDDGRVLVRVSDDGVGMTPAQQELAFEPFNRAGAERDGIEGTGIGLTIVKALVERMGGRVGMHSTPGIGSVFEVVLDAAARSGPLALPARRLLYVEDNEVNVMIVRELVRRRGDVEFDSAPDGASGVARAAQLLPGLTLVDMQLPDIDGLEVLARLRRDPVTAGLRIVALSANAIPADIRRALDAGFDDYWTKPLDFAVFTAELERVFGAIEKRATPAS